MTTRWRYLNPIGRINAVIVDYGTPELATACLDSVRKCDLFQSVAVVDAKGLGWSYARSCNNALKAGTGDIVLALNADTRMLESPDAVLRVFDADPMVAVVGPRQVNSQGNITSAGIFGTNQQPCHRLWQAPLAPHDAETADVREAVTVSGSVYFARRDVWELCGGFLDTPHFYEETWFSYLVRHRGYKVMYCGETTWVHEFNQSPTTGAWRAQRAAQSREIFRAACSTEGILCD